MSIINLSCEDEYISELLKIYGAKYDTELQIATLTCFCDGTGAFLEQMRWLLWKIGCYNIKWETDVNEKYGTEDKPWATCKFTVYGILINGNVCINGSQKSQEPYKTPGKIQEVLNWIDKMVDDFQKKLEDPCNSCYYFKKCEYTALPPDLRGESCQYYSLAERFDKHE